MKATGILWKNLPGQKLAEGHMDENYAVVYQEFLLDPQTGEEAELAAGKLFTYAFTVMTKKSAE